MDTSQRISSALWAMKLLEASRTANANSYQDLLVKVSNVVVTLNFNECPENTKEEAFVFFSCLFATGYADSHLLFINLCPCC